ncbi:MAG: hypothetical protein QOD99_2774, partial [Chthoniobacter sp.]|nr:hypothetical protein [Chthoniobacter sp.]
MIELCLCLTAVLLTIFLGRFSARGPAPIALARMLIAIFSLLVTLRYWFLACRWASELESASAGIIAAVIFWLIFAATAFTLDRLYDTYSENFESVQR